MLTVVQLNLAFDPTVSDPEALLDRYHTLTGWSGAVRAAGASVITVQRFTRAATITREDGEYRFIVDGQRPVPEPWDRPRHSVEAVAAARPDVVHVNGLMFPGAVAALREALPQTTAIVLQDHSGSLPRALPWPFDRLTTARWAQAFSAADACSFTAAALAERWHVYGLPAATPILEIPEASTTIRPQDGDAARAATGVTGRPALLWVGRLDANKDPLTLLDALERALPMLPEAHCTMLFDGGRLEGEVRARVASSARLAARISLVGAVPHSHVALYCSAADVFLSASHHEGSGYALIEALACGATPCVTSIPAFRALAGADACWTPGDADGCARALVARARPVTPADRIARRHTFDSTLHWDAIGRATCAAYARLAAARRAQR